MSESKTEKFKVDYDITDFYDKELKDISELELEHAFPIQFELKNSEARYSDFTWIGEGGMKQIYKVHDKNTGRSLAMALLKENSKPEEVERFLCEARLTSLLEHPNIISIYDTGINEKKQPFFTMELLQGRNLSSILKDLSHGDPKTLEEFNRTSLLHIFTTICDAISYAHSKGVLHLDIKPENIQIGNYGEVTVCDWGLGKLLYQDPDAEITLDTPDPNIINDMTLAGYIKGTPGFMAPEQCVGNHDKKERTDIYSLGALLYTMLTQNKCVPGDCHEDLIKNTLDAKIIPMGSSISNRLQAPVMKAISKDPEDRYATAQDFKNEINNYLHGFATLAEEASFFTQIQLLIQRNKVISKILLASFILILSLSTLYVSNLSKSRNDAIAAKNNAEIAKYNTKKALVKLQDEIRLNESLNQQLRQVLHQIAIDNDYSYPDLKISLMEVGLQQTNKTSEKEKLLKKKGLLCFITQQFDRAYSTYSQLDSLIKREQNIMDLSEKYRTYKKDSDLLPAGTLSEILFNLGVYNRTLSIAAYNYYLEKRKSEKQNPAGDFELLKSILFCINRVHLVDLKNRKLISTKSGYSIDLSNIPLNTFQLPYFYKYRTLLKNFRLETLDLSNTNFKDSGSLYGTHIKVLNISGTPIKYFTKTMMERLHKNGLRTIYLTEENFSAKTIQDFKRYFLLNP